MSSIRLGIYVMCMSMTIMGLVTIHGFQRSNVGNGRKHNGKR